MDFGNTGHQIIDLTAQCSSLSQILGFFPLVFLGAWKDELIPTAIKPRKRINLSCHLPKIESGTCRGELSLVSSDLLIVQQNRWTDFD